MAPKYIHTVTKTIYGIHYDTETAELIAEYRPKGTPGRDNELLFQQADLRFFITYPNGHEICLQRLSKHQAIKWLEGRDLRHLVESVRKRKDNPKIVIFIEGKMFEATVRNELTQVCLGSGKISYVTASLTDGDEVILNQLIEHPLCEELFNAD